MDSIQRDKEAHRVLKHNPKCVDFFLGGESQNNLTEIRSLLWVVSRTDLEDTRDFGKNSPTT